MKIARIEAIPFAVPVPQAAALRLRRGAHRRARAGPGAHRRRDRGRRRGAAAPVHLRRDAGVDRRRDRHGVRPRDRGPVAARPRDRSGPASTAPSPTRRPSPRWTWPSGTRWAAPSTCPSRSCWAAGPIGCASRTWSGSPRDAEMVAEAERVRDTYGITTFKVKVGRRPAALDVGACRALRTALGPDVELYVDGNRGWTPSEAGRALRAMADLDLTLSEELCPADDVLGRRCADRADHDPDRRRRERHDPGRGDPRAARRGRHHDQHQDRPDRVRRLAADPAPVRGPGRRGRDRQPDRRPDRHRVRRRVRRRAPRTARAAPASSPTSWTCATTCSPSRCGSAPAS